MIKINLAGKNNEKILDILIKDIFCTTNSYRKVKNMLLGGEDLEKLKKEQVKKNKKYKVVSVLYKFFGKISSAEKATTLEIEREKTSQQHH